MGTNALLNDTLPDRNADDEVVILQYCGKHVKYLYVINIHFHVIFLIDEFQIVTVQNINEKTKWKIITSYEESFRIEYLK